MKKYKIILVFNDGREIDSVLLDEKPTQAKALEGVEFYKADSYRIEAIEEQNSFYRIEYFNTLFDETYRSEHLDFEEASEKAKRIKALIEMKDVKLYEMKEIELE